MQQLVGVLYSLFTDADAVDIAVGESGDNLVYPCIVGKAVISLVEIFKGDAAERELVVIAEINDTAYDVGDVVFLIGNRENVVSDSRIAVGVSGIGVVEVVAVCGLEQHYPGH